MLPSTIGRLDSLEWLIIDNNGMTSLPNELGDMSRLANIYATANLITELPPVLNRLRSLEILDLSDNPLREISQGIRLVSSLQRLVCRNCMLTSLPDAVGLLPNLQILELTSNRIQALPRSIKAMTSLESLLMSDNGMSSGIPELPPNVKTVHLQRNDLVGPVPDMGHVAGTVDLSGNKRLTQVLGAWTCNATAVRTLLLEGMDLDTASIGKCDDGAVAGMTSLENLILSNNQLTASDIPRMSHLFRPNLRKLDLENNPLGGVDGMDEAFSDDVRLGSLVLRNTDLWLQSNQIVDLLRYKPVRTTTGLLDLSGNQITYFVRPDARSDAVAGMQSVTFEENGLVWGQAISEFFDPFRNVLGSVETINAHGTSFQGNLPSPTEVPLLRTIDISGGLSQSHAFDEHWSAMPSDNLRPAGDGSILCPTSVAAVRGASVGYEAVVDPEFYAYSFCSCAPGFFGQVDSSGTGCSECPPDAECTGVTLKATGSWPVPPEAPRSLVRCPASSTEASPCGDLEYNMATGEVDIECVEGYRGRMCSLCADGYHSLDRSCEPCEPGMVWLPFFFFYGLRMILTASVVLVGRGLCDWARLWSRQTPI